MAEWWMQGLLARLLDPTDDMARKIRQLCTVRIVPNVNPDGAIMGHLRTNAVGANLNRTLGLGFDVYRCWAKCMLNRTNDSRRPKNNRKTTVKQPSLFGRTVSKAHTPPPFFPPRRLSSRHAHRH